MSAGLPAAESALPATERGSLRWYWNRLSVMPVAETLYRAGQSASRATQHGLARLGAGAPSPALVNPLPPPWLGSARALPRGDAAHALARAQALLEGRWLRLDGREVVIGTRPTWTDAGADPAHDDVRHLMELHRHAHLVPLAQAWAITQDARYRDAVLDQLTSWLDSCRFPEGTAWASALDAGMRLLNWSLVWQLLGAAADGGASLPRDLRARWLDSVYLHAQTIRLNLSRYSSANNHLLGELLGLVVADASWPFWPRVRQWGRRARTQLAHEALRQNAPDGSNREQASWYQAFVFELLALHLRICEARGWPVPPAVRERLASMARFAAALRDSGGHVSHHGDADHARAIALASADDDDDALDAMLSLAVALDIAPELAPLVRRPSQRAPWLLGRDTPRPRAGNAAAVRAALTRCFTDAGMYQLGTNFGAADEVLMTLDAGPIGYLGIAAHGHADALALRLSVDGLPLLVDRGTGSYNTEPGWRRHFRGTLAHNTVCLDGEDQSVYGGPFLWLQKARCQVETFWSDDQRGVFEACHDGYRRLPGRPLHTRRVEWEGPLSCFAVTDYVTTRGRHHLAIAWHADPACEAWLDGPRARLRRAGVTLTLTVNASSAAGSWSLHHGAADEMLGWHSPRLGMRVPAPTFVWRAPISGPVRVTTLLEIDRSTS